MKLKISILAAFLVAAAGGYYLLGGGSTPEGQAGLVSLSTGNFSTLKTAFNADADAGRVVMLVSPT